MEKKLFTKSIFTEEILAAGISLRAKNPSGNLALTVSVSEVFRTSVSQFNLSLQLFTLSVVFRHKNTH